MEQLLQYFTPNLYQLYLTIDRTTETINGTVCIFGIPQNSEFAKFHAVGLKISSVVARKALPGDENLIYKNFSDFLDCDFEQKHGEIKIKNIFPAQNSQIQYKIDFSTTLNKNMQGCYLSNYLFNGVDKKIATTQFESHYARECFPCIDEPAAKAEFIVQLDIPDLQDDDVVLFNTPLESQKAKTFTFQRTPRMSTYLLAWVIGAFQKVETTNKNGIKVASYCALNQSLSSLNFANEVAARSLEYYDDKFGLPYPLAKLDQVALPDFEAGAMENWGLVTYRESCMLAEPNASVDTKQSVAITVTHELSHQWFGDLVTMQWWDDLWLNESFATIMEYYATDTLYPELKAWQDFFTGDCVAALRRDALPGVQAVQQPVNDPAEIATLFDGAIVYAKGARLVLMLMRLMGEENFYRGVRDYFAEYQYQNTVGDDLWDKLQPYADFGVKNLMHIWISQPGYPMIWQTEDSINQQRFLINGDTDISKWPLPKVKDDMSGIIYLILALKSSKPRSLPLIRFPTNKNSASSSTACYSPKLKRLAPIHYLTFCQSSLLKTPPSGTFSSVLLMTSKFSSSIIRPKKPYIVSSCANLFIIASKPSASHLKLTIIAAPNVSARFLLLLPVLPAIKILSTLLLPNILPTFFASTPKCVAIS